MRIGRKVRYIGSGYFTYLTNDKVYDVVDYYPSRVEYNDKIRVINDQDMLNDYYLYGNSNEPLFEDVTMVFRNEVIDNILG